VVILRVP